MSHNLDIRVSVNNNYGTKCAQIEAHAYEIGRYRYSFYENVFYPNWFEQKVLKRTFDEKVKKAIFKIKQDYERKISNSKENEIDENRIKESANEILNRTS